MLRFVLSLPANVTATVASHVTLLSVLVALMAAAAVLGRMAVLLRADGATPARHRPHPVSAPPAPPVAAEPEPFDPFTSPLDEVEAFLRSLGLPTPAELDEAHSDALREDWARSQVAKAGKSWETHLAKFSGAVLPREDDTRELETVQ